MPIRSHALLATATVLALTGCSADQHGFDTGNGQPDGTSNDASHDGTVHTDVVPITDTHEWMLTPDSACARQVADTQRAPMNLLFLLDRSGSMQDSGKWTALVAAMHHLVATLATTSPETRVGITFFPARSNPDVVDGYRTPAVPLAPLSMNRSTVDGLLDSTSPNGNTPMACAIAGTEDDMGYYSGVTFTGSHNVVLVTDGQPTEECSGVTCGIFDINCLIMAGMASATRIQSTAAHAASAVVPPIRTFVVGTPDASDAFLSQLAVNGNTARSPGCEAGNTCHYSLGSSTFEMDLNHALDEIRGRAATCEFRITANVSMADPSLVNVLYTPSSGATPQLVHRDTTHANGWDWSADQMSVLLYGAACDAVLTNSTGGQVQILFGCPPG